MADSNGDIEKRSTGVPLYQADVVPKHQAWPQNRTSKMAQGLVLVRLRGGRDGMPVASILPASGIRICFQAPAWVPKAHPLGLVHRCRIVYRQAASKTRHVSRLGWAWLPEHPSPNQWFGPGQEVQPCGARDPIQLARRVWRFWVQAVWWGWGQHSIRNGSQSRSVECGITGRRYKWPPAEPRCVQGRPWCGLEGGIFCNDSRHPKFLQDNKQSTARTDGRVSAAERSSMPGYDHRHPPCVHGHCARHLRLVPLEWGAVVLGKGAVAGVVFFAVTGFCGHFPPGRIVGDVMHSYTPLAGSKSRGRPDTGKVERAGRGEGGCDIWDGWFCKFHDTVATVWKELYILWHHRPRGTIQRETVRAPCMSLGSNMSSISCHIKWDWKEFEAIMQVETSQFVSRSQMIKRQPHSK